MFHKASSSQIYRLQKEFAAYNSLTQFLRIEAAPATNFSDTKIASVFIGLSSANFLHTKFHHDEMHIIEYLLLKYPLRKRVQPPARTTERPRHTRHLYSAYPSLLHRFFIAFSSRMACHSWFTWQFAPSRVPAQEAQAQQVKH